MTGFRVTAFNGTTFDFPMAHHVYEAARMFERQSGLHAIDIKSIVAL